MTKLFVLIAIVLGLSSCSENYSNGERIGLVTQFSETGIFWKSWEGHLNVTQTGMNSSVPFDFSVDNDRPDEEVIKMLDSAANQGWKVKLTYHETFGWNWFNNRGSTDHFITDVQILDRQAANIFGHTQDSSGAINRQGKIIDTIYVVIYEKHTK